MSRWATLAGGAALFALVATANAGGYRYGVSDQAFYVPVIAQTLDPALFPRDTDLFGPQARLWPGRHLFAGVARALSLDLPALFGLAYLLTLALLFAAAVGLARGLGFGGWTTSAFLTLLCLRHQIARTGANSLEGYMHPRMLAFAAGLGALALLVRQRTVGAWLTIAAAALIHPTTACWFAAVAAVAGIGSLAPKTRPWAGVALAALALAAAAAVLGLNRGPLVMDAAWRDVLRDRTYLFPSGWPVSVWALNLLYPVVIGAIYRRRRMSGAVVPGEGPVVAGLIALAAAFLASVPLSAAGLTAVVQLQVPRVFWVLDAMTAAYVAWWLVEDVAARRGVRTRLAVVALLAVAALLRGAYVIRIERQRPLARVALPADAWTDVTAWLRTQPREWHVLAHPVHASLYGSSVRVAAYRDTFLELGKDAAMALYDRDVAMRVAERAPLVAGEFTPDQLALLRDRFAVDVLVTDLPGPLDRPVLYRNARFVVYDLR